jgi:hypothetical protein
MKYRNTLYKLNVNLVHLCFLEKLTQSNLQHKILGIKIVSRASSFSMASLKLSSTRLRSFPFNQVTF